MTQDELLLHLLDIEPYRWSSIGTAILCGFIIGLERQLRGKPVGIRTSALIVTGTYLFVSTALSLDSAMVDPSRIIGQVVTGVGFLGAGVMMTRDGTVLGVTSAATIWVLAALGICVGAIGNLVAIKLALVVLGILYGVETLEQASHRLTRGAHAHYIYWRRAARRSWRPQDSQQNPPASGKEQGDG